MKINDKAELLTELNQLLAREKASEDNVLNKVLANILARLDKLENLMTASQDLADKTTALHPSQQKFQIAEANELLLPNTNEKACRFEPDKPCDYCSMCSARGF